MKTKTVLVFFAFVSLTFTAWGSSGVKGLTIPNAHELTAKKSPGRVLRGSQPLSKVSELNAIGVTDVLIFKNEIKTEVRDEASALKELGIKVRKIPFQWKDIEDTEAACEQVVEAELLLEKIAGTKNKAIFFHCTVGEDRTGLLAGIFRMSNQNWTAEDAFKKEMCPNGFADGNPKKPAQVAATVRKELYPVFVMAAEAVRISKEKGVRLNKRFCNKASISGLSEPYPKCK